MSSIDTSIFLDVSDALGISSPSIVEKDYWATQLLSHISRLELEGYQLVFSGGTCLAKAHQNTFRMSEDIDIKMVPHEETLHHSKNQQQVKNLSPYFEEQHLTPGTTKEQTMKPLFAMFTIYI